MQATVSMGMRRVGQTGASRSSTSTRNRNEADKRQELAAPRDEPELKTMVVLRSGYLIKEPLHGHFLSRPRKRYF